MKYSLSPSAVSDMPWYMIIGISSSERESASLTANFDIGRAASLPELPSEEDDADEKTLPRAEPPIQTERLYKTPTQAKRQTIIIGKKFLFIDMPPTNIF